MARRGKRRHRRSTASKRDRELGTKLIGYSISAFVVLSIMVAYPWVFWVTLIVCLAALLLPRYLKFKGYRSLSQLNIPKTTSSNFLDGDLLGGEGHRRVESLRELQEHVILLDPYQFESFVAESFERAGWYARPTKGSGDFGADVVAERPGVKIVIQVKQYTTNVNLKAVQEIAAARPHYKADYAIVLTSANGYAASAHRLAESNRVLLWTLEELRCLRSGITPRDLPVPSPSPS